MYLLKEGASRRSGVLLEIRVPLLDATGISLDMRRDGVHFLGELPRSTDSAPDDARTCLSLPFSPNPLAEAADPRRGR